MQNMTQGSDQDTAPSVTIILGIPGPWNTDDELAQAIADQSSNFSLTAGTLTYNPTGQHFRLETVDHDPELRRSYELANRMSLTQADLDLIGAHRRAAYLIGPGGSLDTTRDMMLAAAALLDAGGFAVKVETAGVAHSARDWLAQTSRRDTHVGALYIAYMALIGSRGTFYSCGMHNLGFADALVSAGLSAAQAGELLRGFLMSIVHEQPLLISGQTTMSDDNGVRYQLNHEPCHLFPPDDPFHNPYGLWRLSPL
ncbi:MAG: hypothetical protein M1546_22040 [Chloroflexi bacterium]|nr:hypothetical protein [Chloroflexota bacterium]